MPSAINIALPLPISHTLKGCVTGFGTKVISLIAVCDKYRIAFAHLSHPERVCYRVWGGHAMENRAGEDPAGLRTHRAQRKDRF